MGHGCCQSKKSCCDSNQEEKAPMNSAERPTEISRTMTIDDIFEFFPARAQKLAQVLTNAGLHCVGCRAATWETLEVGCKTHGMTDEQIDKLVINLNDVLKQELSDENTVTLTEAAAEKFRFYLATQGNEAKALRFGLEASGCNGFGYVLDFSEKAGENDLVFHSQGIDIHLDMGFADQLIGSEIDYVDGLMGGGFKITNTRARSSCGCGKSHSYQLFEAKVIMD